MKIGQLIGILLILLLLLLGATYALTERSSTSPQATVAGVGADLLGGDVGDATTTVVTTRVIHIVEYTDQGFEPAVVEPRVGDVVRFVNTTDGVMWVASLPHDTHGAYSGTTYPDHCASSTDAFDQCSAGDEYDFVVGKRGAWEYHNHLVPSMTGTVRVVGE